MTGKGLSVNCGKISRCRFYADNTLYTVSHVECYPGVGFLKTVCCMLCYMWNVIQVLVFCKQYAVCCVTCGKLSRCWFSADSMLCNVSHVEDYPGVGFLHTIRRMLCNIWKATQVLLFCRQYTVYCVTC